MKKLRCSYLKRGETKGEKVKVKLGETVSKTVYYGSSDAPPRAPETSPCARLQARGYDLGSPYEPMPPMASHGTNGWIQVEL